MNKIIPLSIYPFDVMISFDETNKKLKKRIAMFGIKYCDSLDFGGTSKKQGRMVMFQGNQTIIRLNFLPDKNNPEDMGLLQHEIFHAVGFIMEEIDTPLTKDTHEAYAYLTQYLTEKIYKYLYEKQQGM